MGETLSATQITEALAQTPEWTLESREITRQFQFKDFVQAMRFVNAVADAAEKANHHPDIDIRWNKVLLRLSTHSKGGLTEADFQLAAQINAINSSSTMDNK
ncbi:MAG: 4a-hydroxytetrahydrobiopterin dehydratase [Chthoniobacterales bacterium]